MGTSSKMPFHFDQCGRLPFKHSLSPEHWQSNPAHEDWTCYCIQVTDFRGGWRWPAPTSLFRDLFVNCQHVPEWPWKRITGAVVLAPGEVILFFRWWLLKEGLLLGDARDVGFHLGGPVNWASREAQVEMMVSIVQEGHWAIPDAIVEKRTKARGPGCPMEQRNKLDPTASYNIEEWMPGLEEDASKAKVRNDEMSNHGTEQKNVCS